MTTAHSRAHATGRLLYALTVLGERYRHIAHNGCYIDGTDHEPDTGFDPDLNEILTSLTTKLDQMDAEELKTALTTILWLLQTDHDPTQLRPPRTHTGDTHSPLAWPTRNDIETGRHNGSHWLIGVACTPDGRTDYTPDPTRQIPICGHDHDINDRDDRIREEGCAYVTHLTWAREATESGDRVNAQFHARVADRILRHVGEVPYGDCLTIFLGPILNAAHIPEPTDWYQAGLHDAYLSHITRTHNDDPYQAESARAELEQLRARIPNLEEHQLRAYLHGMFSN